MVPIKLAIFDFGDVIGHFNVSHFNKFIKLNGGKVSTVKDYFEKNKAEFDKNNIIEKKFWTGLAKETNIELPWRILAENNTKNLMIDYKMIQLIKSISINKVMLSNMDITTSKQIKQELQLKTLFTESYFSYELKRNKMDKNILDMICKKKNVEPHNVLFIDDFVGNVRKAKAYGFQAIHFVDYSSLKNKLIQLKVLM